MFRHGLATPFSLDVTTLFVVAVGVAALLGVFLLCAWTQDRIRALAWWGAAYLTGGLSAGLWLAGQRAMPSMPSTLPSALLFLSCGMVWNAARLFHDRPIIWPAMFAGAAVWMIACTTVLFPPTGASRAVLASLIVSVYVVLAAAELWRERRKSLIRRWPALFVPALHGAVFLFPIPLAGLLPQQDALVTFAAGWLSVFVLELLLYAVGAAFIVLVLTKERTLRSHKTAALTDPLTGLFNRRGLVEVTRDVTHTSGRGSRPITVLVFDLDHFKSINDRFGHAVGDEVLRLFASVASANMRTTDFLARLGGEEFAAMVQGTLDEGIMIGERLRVAFESAARTVAGRYIGATVSVGVAAHAAATNIDALLARADEALYAAKSAGRNRVEAELPHLDGPRAAPAVAPAPAAAPTATIDWSSDRRPRGAQGREAA